MGEVPERVAVLGAGRSGLAAARCLAARGHRVLLSELRGIPKGERSGLEAAGITLEEGGHTPRVLESELIVLSPGVPPRLPILEEARVRGVPIWGELELGYRLLRSRDKGVARRIIAVTGTNGKSTTVELIGQLLRKAGLETLIAGNIGEPLCALLDRVNAETVLVLEVSSFQLETVEEFHPHVAVFTNFSPDHLDRHGSVEAYFAVKCRIFRNQGKEDFAVVQRELSSRLPRLRARAILFSAEDRGVRQLPLPLPRHLREDIAAALRAARLLAPGVDLEAFEPGWLELPHRLEFVAEVGGVRFYDDSKATNVAATLAALGTFAEPVTVILGGRSKGGGFGSLAQRLKERGDFALLIGEAGPEIAKALDRIGYRGYRFVADLEEAVATALELGHKVCLLAPACASFDMFRDYAARGRAFQEAVRGLNRSRFRSRFHFR